MELPGLSADSRNFCMNASAVVLQFLSTTFFLTKRNKKVFSYSSSVHISSSSPKPNNCFQITDSHIYLCFRENLWVWSSSVFTSSTHWSYPKKMKGLWKVFCIIYRGKKQDDWNTAWHLFSLREKRLPLSSSCQTAWGFRRTEALLGDRRVRRDRSNLPALLCMSLKEEAARLQMWMRRAEGKSIHTTWRTAGHRFRQTEQASNFGSVVLSVITSHYWH